MRRQNMWSMWLAAFFCMVAAAAAAGERRAASYVPADCWLTLCYDGSHPGLRETPLHQFLQEPEVRAAFEQWRPLLERLYRAMDEGTGFPMSPALRTALGTAVAVGLGPQEAGRDGPTMVAAIRVGRAGALGRKAFEALMAKTRETAKADTVRELQIGQVRATSFVDQDGDPHHYAFDGEFFIDSNSEALLRRALGADTAKLAAQLGAERALLRIRYDHPAMLKHFGGEIDEDGRRVLDALGISAVRTAEVLLVPRGKRLAAELRIAVPDGAKAGGLAKWLADAPPVDRSLLKRVPRDATLWWATSADVAGLWDTIWEVVAKANPQGGEEGKRDLAALEEKLGLKVRDAFLAPLGRGTVMVASPGIGLLGGSGTVIQRVKDPKRLEASLAQLVNRLDLLLMGQGGGLAGGPVRTELKPFQYRGHACRYLWLMGQPALLLGGWAPCYTRLGDVFVFARHPLDLKDYIDFVEDGRPSVLDNPEFAKLQALVPANAASVSYGEWSREIVSLYNTLAPLLQLLQGFGDEMELPQALDVANMPSSRLLRRYARGSVAYSVYEEGRYRAVMEGDGLVLLSPHVMPVGVGGGAATLLLLVWRTGQGEGRLIRDRNNLNLLAKGFATYLNEHGDNRRYPSGIGELFDKEVLKDKKVLISPLDKNPPKLPNGLPCSYVSCFDKYPKRQFLDDFPPNILMAWDREPFLPGKRSVLFFDSHVEVVDEARFEQLSRELDQRVKQHTKERKPKTEF